MGTNFYRRKDRKLIHLGKSSIGWKFQARAKPKWRRDEARARWVKLVRKGGIEDEYGCSWTPDELLEWVDHKQTGRCHLENHGPDVSGPLHDPERFGDFHCDGYDFSDQEFS